MKHLKLFFALFAMLALGVGNAWGAEVTETIKMKGFGGKTNNAYQNVTVSGTSDAGTAMVAYAYNGSTGQVRGNKTTVAGASVTNSDNGKNWSLYNSQAMGGAIKSITITQTATGTNKFQNQMYVSLGTTTQGAVTAIANAQQHTSLDANTITFDIDPSKGYTYFKLLSTKKFATGTIAGVEVKVTYETAGGDEGGEETVLSVEPKKVDFGTKNIYFESEKQGSLEIEITGQNLTGDVTATLSGIDANIFDLSQESFTPEDGEVSEKLTVSYEVSEEKGYTATLTLSSDGVDAIELPITLTTVNKKPTIYTKVTDAATLSAGDKVIFVYEADKKAAGAFPSGKGFLEAIDITQALNTSANPATASITDEAVVEYTLGGKTGAWELISTAGKLSEKTANTGSSVDLKANGDTKWTISITGGNATIKGSDNTIQYNASSPRFRTYTSGQKAIQLYSISVPKYAITFAQPAGGELLVKNGETAITSGNTFAEGIKLTVTATPANGYEGGTVVVKDADGNDVTATVYADGVLTMPAYAVTISATFEKKPCELLAKPTVSATTTYSSATLTWEAVANAAKYSVKVGTEDAVETTETSYEVTGLNAETTYTYQVQAIAEADQDTYCDSEVAEGTFTTTAAPVATLTLKDIVGTTTLTGSLNGTITLPTEAAECSKTFVGWDADENCDHAPTYASGAEYKFEALTQTLYAVYADENNAAKEEVYTFTEFTQANTVTIDAPESFTVILQKGDASTAPQWNPGSSQARVYAKGSLVISADAPISKIVYTYVVNENSKGVKPTIEGVSGSNNAGNWDASTKTWTGNDTKVTFSTSGTAGNVGFTKVAVTVGAITYSNYSTTCAAALEKPTFSVAEGTYTEAKSIELSATEGDIYYTLDGSNPTKESNKYENIPVLLDQCGTTTIKAIAISTESQSPVASATYTINLPITNTAATAYTPAEAIAIIDGECDKTEEVFVKGVVVSTSEFNATYGNYDVIVKAVDDNSATPTTFTFYRMYKAASNTKFTESDEVIGVGDIITAKGKLTKYNSTYELADGCYMVERVAYTEPKTDISNTLETAYTVDKAFELISDIKSDLDKEVYVKGLVAVASTELYEEKYLTYSISDNGQNSGNVLKVYDGLDINGVAFTSKDDVKVGDYVVVKGKLLNYKGTYEINKDNQLVQHVKAATITIADFTMEVGETKTIAATITPAEAAVTYAIKENAANAISLSGNTITALVEGTATITATVADGATYLGNSVDFTVTVGPKAESEEVVILAEYNGNWYALKAATGSGSNSLAALEVTYFNGILYNVTEADKASITWTRTIVGNQVTFKNGENYLTGGTGTGLSLANASFEWTYKIEDGQDTYIYEYEDKGSIKSRTFLFYKDGYFKNYATSNAKPTQTEYSGYPVVTDPGYDTAIEIGSGDNSTVIAPNQGQKVNVIVDRAFEAGEEWYTLCVPFNMQASLIGTAYQLSGLVQKGTDYVEVNLAAKPTIEAGKPYLVQPNVTVNKFVVENVTILNTTGESIAKSIEGLSVTMQGVINGDGTTDGLYWVGNYGYLYNDSASKLGLRTYFKITTPSGIAPRMRVVAGENVETGVEDLFTTDAPVKVIENGQLIIIRDGIKYNVQGQKL